MKKSELKKRKYVPLAIKIVNVELESIMATGSGDHAGIGQGGSFSRTITNYQIVSIYCNIAV